MSGFSLDVNVRDKKITQKVVNAGNAGDQGSQLGDSRRRPAREVLVDNGKIQGSMSKETETERPSPRRRSDYKAFRSIGTRWQDNDVYGHVNNVVYYSWFDTAVNAFLIEHGVLDIHAGQTIGLVIETHCNYFSPLAFPETVEAGIRVARLGRTSVRYEVGLFARGQDIAAAQGHFIHVYVDRQTRRPVSLSPQLQSVLESIA